MANIWLWVTTQHDQPTNQPTQPNPTQPTQPTNPTTQPKNHSFITFGTPTKYQPSQLWVPKTPTDP